MTLIIKSMPALVLSLLIGIFFAAYVESQDEYMSVQAFLCNNEQLKPNDPLITAVDDVLLNLSSAVPMSAPKYSYYTSKTEQGKSAYGYGCCDADQSGDDCFECLDTCANEFFDKCGNAVGAQINMTYCFIRYENYPFM